MSLWLGEEGEGEGEGIPIMGSAPSSVESFVGTHTMELATWTA